jgi:FkbM family methyltransferase
MAIDKNSSFVDGSDCIAATALLLAELKVSRKTTVVDVGANPINPPPYADLLKLGGCKVVGFEPQPDAFAKLQQSKSEDEVYFPFAVGDGNSIDLRIYKASGMTSIFDLYVRAIRAVGMGVPAKLDKVRLDTVALDNVQDLPPFDLLKIDIQGGENLVFGAANQVLKQAVAVIVELRYLRLYHGEPMMGGVDTELRRQGFYLHKFMFSKSMPLRNSQARRLKAKLVSDQLVDGDGIYIKNIATADKLGDEQIKHLAILGASVFASHSLVLFCLDELVKRGVVSSDLPAAYVDLLPDRLRNTN